MNLLEVHHLKKHYATQKAVDDISFSIEEGTIFGLLGPNGAGKTTLLRMITGIFYPDSGEIILNGKKFDPENDILNIGYMPEERGLYKKMKIGEQAVYLAQLKGLTKNDATAKVKAWFEKFEMQSWWNKKVEDLSKGMGQKLQFVTTVLHEPKLIILDEPFSGLDPVNSNLIKEEIHNLAKKGHTIIFSTHRMEQVEEICDKIILVNKGQKVLDNTVKGAKEAYKENLFSVSFENKEGKDYLNANEYFDFVSQDGEHGVIKLEPGITPSSALEYLLSNYFKVYAYNEILPSLNDIFIKIVSGTPTARQFQVVN
jgi:ABC-2 type transport system ATP-binding protein